MSKKEMFSEINTNSVYSTINDATQGNERKTYTAEEALQFMNYRKTSGRKGVKLHRINMGFSPANLNFIRIMSRVRGQNMTDFVNDMLDKYREEYAAEYAKALEFIESL